MKKVFYSVMAALVITACQVIPEADRLIPLEQGEIKSNVLLVEFTGFTCVNCPNAAAVAHDLLAQYPENLVVVAMHPWTSSFCQTKVDKYNYTCPESDSIFVSLGGSSTTSFPTGVVNMTSGFQDYATWPTQVSSAMMREKRGELTLSVTSSSDRTFEVVYHADALSEDVEKTGTEVTYNVMLWLVEDEIDGAQMMPDGSQNMHYTHNHLLRGSALPSVWGEPTRQLINIPSNGIEVVAFSVPDSIHGQAINIDHCSLVGVLTDGTTNEVVDVKQTKIIQ